MGDRGLKFVITYVFLLSSLHHRILLSMETVAVIKGPNQRDQGPYVPDVSLVLSPYH